MRSGRNHPVDDISHNRAYAIGRLQDINAELSPSDSTGIGGALLTASEEFSNSPPDSYKAIITLTDGIENESPYIDEVLPTIEQAYENLHFFCVGIGSDIASG